MIAVERLPIYATEVCCLLCGHEQPKPGRCARCGSRAAVGQISAASPPPAVEPSVPEPDPEPVPAWKQCIGIKVRTGQRCTKRLVAADRCHDCWARERYQTDPEWRARQLAYQAAARARQKAAKGG